MVTMPLQGFSQGAQPITSYNFGAGNWKRVSENFKLLVAVSMIYACQNTFLALGNATVSIFLALLRKVILLLPLIFILPHVLPGQVKAVFWAEPFADMIAVTVTGILFFRKYGKSLCKKMALIKKIYLVETRQKH